MSIPQASPANDEEYVELENHPPAHHPAPPSDELFDISTTVDPSYVISLIRKLLPRNVSSSRNFHGVYPCGVSTQESTNEEMEGNTFMDTTEMLSKLDCPEAAEDNELVHQHKNHVESLGDKAWEEYGCILWDLAGSKMHADFMVQNLILDVLLASLIASTSARVTEISLGIIGNLACHKISRKCIASTNAMIETIVDQLFLDDTPCLCEVFRLLTLCVQGREGFSWVQALQPEHILRRIFWIAENTLNPLLAEKSVGLLLALLENEQEIATVLLPTLINLGLSTLLINILDFEMSKLTGERIPERYSVLDVILRTIEALSVLDDYSQEICSSNKLFGLLIDLIILPDKIEVANSCITATVLIANILIDAPNLAVEISKDLCFFQGLLDMFPFASDDLEAQSALWSIMARLLVQIQDSDFSISCLHQYVTVLVSKSDMIEELLFDHQLDESREDNQTDMISVAKLHTRTAALRSFSGILNRWVALEDNASEHDFGEKVHIDKEGVNKLLDICHRYTEITNKWEKWYKMRSSAVTSRSILTMMQSDF